MRRRLLVAVVAATLGFLYFYLGRDYPPSMSTIMALAIGALVYAAQRTGDHLRDIYRR